MSLSVTKLVPGEDPQGQNVSLQFTPLLRDCSTTSPFGPRAAHACMLIGCARTKFTGQRKRLKVTDKD